MKFDLNKIGGSLLVIMFLLSGINKIYTFNDSVNSLQQKLSFMENKLVSIIIIIVILLEILAPSFIIYNFVTGKNKAWAYYSVIGLIVFTILATIIYHPPDFSNYKSINSILG